MVGLRIIIQASMPQLRTINLNHTSALLLQKWLYKKFLLCRPFCLIWGFPISLMVRQIDKCGMPNLQVPALHTMHSQNLTKPYLMFPSYESIMQMSSAFSESFQRPNNFNIHKTSEWSGGNRRYSTSYLGTVLWTKSTENTTGRGMWWSTP